MQQYLHLHARRVPRMNMHIIYTKRLQELDWVELFAGEQAVSKALTAAGLRGHAHDIGFDKSLDILGVSGFLP